MKLNDKSGTLKIYTNKLYLLKKTCLWLLISGGCAYLIWYRLGILFPDNIYAALIMGIIAAPLIYLNVLPHLQLLFMKKPALIISPRGLQVDIRPYKVLGEVEWSFLWNVVEQAKPDDVSKRGRRLLISVNDIALLAGTIASAENRKRLLKLYHKQNRWLYQLHTLQFNYDATQLKELITNYIEEARINNQNSRPFTAFL